jgi:hypothetical protein
MKELNDYIFNVFNLIKNVKDNGLLERPKKYKLNRFDKNILINVYDLYKVYKLKITKKQFIDLVIEYSLNTNTNILKSGIEVGENIEKIINS